jgi:hypothetical protein
MSFDCKINTQLLLTLLARDKIDRQGTNLEKASKIGGVFKVDVKNTHSSPNL